jgi:2C-methyl-D-erythritol 2,4-cyclodiphosphate synthase
MTVIHQWRSDRDAASLAGMQAAGSSDADAAQLAVLDAVLAAIERSEEVLRVAYQAADRSEVVAKLQDLLGIDSTQAIAIGDLQIFRLNAEDRTRLQQQRADLRSRIDT